MPYTDLPLEALRAYRPALVEPPDLDVFWADTLADARTHPLDATFERMDNGLAVIDTFDVTFRGFGGSPIRGWLHLPAGADGARPAVVEYIGYGGGRGLPHERLLWAAAGYAHLVMDTRGQGSRLVGRRHAPTRTPTASPAQPGFMTRGHPRSRTYYYRRVFTDAVRAVEAVREHPAVDPARVVVTGGSQGGGIALAVAGLRAGPGRGDARCAVPVRLRPGRSDHRPPPYPEIARYLKAHRDHVERVFAHPAYFDVAALGRRATAPAAVLGRADGRDLPALHGLRRIQPLRRAEGDRRVPVQRPRGRRRLP